VNLVFASNGRIRSAKNEVSIFYAATK
jgi:hypothetical protein